jgi:thiol-disulfide isomerase/thioredoxin
MSALCVFAGGAFAQEEETEPNPIKWSLKAVDSSAPVKPGDRFVVELSAQIDKGWHLYSTEQVEGGPKPTRITFPTGQAFEQAGEIDSPAPHSSFDPNFQVETEFYEESVTFAIPLRRLPNFTADASKVVVNVRYQTCTRTVCLPPKLLKIEVPVQPAAANSEVARLTTKSSVAARDSSGNVDVGAEVPNFDFTDFTGKTRRFAEFRGHYVLLDFWATWCSPCLADLPHLKELYLKYHDKGLEIIGMDSETLGTGQADPEFAKETQARAREIIATRGVTWTQATADTAVPAAVKVFGVASLPAKILVDPQGHVVARIKNGPELDHLLATLLAARQ